MLNSQQANWNQKWQPKWRRD